MQSVAIIAAGGLGKRMKLGGGLSKQMLEIGGYPVIHHTLSAFERARSIAGIYVATKQDSIETLEQLCDTAGFRKVRAIIEGGRERQDSIRNAIERIEADVTKGSIVMPEAILVHDGARPFIQPEEVDEIEELSRSCGACVPATKPKDTIKYISHDNPEVFGETLQRSMLLQVQTPQGFSAGMLVDAHHRAVADNCYATDDAALVERYFPDQQIRIYEMGYHNIKITTPEDLGIGEAIYKTVARDA